MFFNMRCMKACKNSAFTVHIQCILTLTFNHHLHSLYSVSLSHESECIAASCYKKPRLVSVAMRGVYTILATYRLDMTLSWQGSPTV